MTTHLLCLVDVYFHTVGIHMGVNWAPLPAGLFRNVHTDFIHVQGLLKKTEKKLILYLNFTSRYIDDVLLLTNSKFGDYCHRIHHIELEKKDITDAARSASYLDLHPSLPIPHS